MPVKLKPRSRAKGFVENGQAVERALRDIARELGPERARTKLNRALREASRPVLQEVRSTTPVESGQLRRSSGIRVLNRQWKRLFPREPTAAVGVGYWFSRRRHLKYRANSLEFGNRRFLRPARQIILRAFQRSCGQVQAGINREFRKIVNEAAKRGVAGKQGVRLSGRITGTKGRPVRAQRLRRGL